MHSGARERVVYDFVRHLTLIRENLTANFVYCRIRKVWMGEKSWAHVAKMKCIFAGKTRVTFVCFVTSLRKFTFPPLFHPTRSFYRRFLITFPLLVVSPSWDYRRFAQFISPIAPTHPRDFLKPITSVKFSCSSLKLQTIDNSLMAVAGWRERQRDKTRREIWNSPTRIRSPSS